MTGLCLINPKNPYNVGGALRAAANLGADALLWTGDRVYDGNKRIGKGAGATVKNAKYRLPREERLRDYQHVRWHQDDHALDTLMELGLTPVCVEVLDESESLIDFVHPDDPVYVFGPEDGSVPKGYRHACHRFVTVPSAGCLNLAATINVVLYDRMAKERAGVLA